MILIISVSQIIIEIVLNIRGMKKILALTDFSKYANNGLHSAFVLGEAYNADVDIFHGLTKGELVKWSPGDKQKFQLFGANGVARVLSDEWMKKDSDYSGKINFLIRSGKVVEYISLLTDEKKPDLIVMGSTGLGKKKRFIWGSNTEAVVKSVNCPVLVIKEPIPSAKFKNIVFASSFDLKEKEVFQYFMDLIKPPADAVIHFLSIDTTSYFSQPTIVMKSAMEDFTKLGYPQKTLTHFYSDYSISSGIRHFVEKTNPDLLVMSNKINKPLKHAFQGNQAVKMAADTDVPVLTIDYT